MSKRACPYCGTRVRSGSLRCRSCREWFERRCEVCGTVVTGDEARVGRCAAHRPASGDEAPPLPWFLRYELDGQGGGMIFVYGEPYDPKGPSRGRRFQSLSDLPRWMERAIRSDAARSGLRSGVLEVDRDVDWRVRDRLDDRREDEEREDGVG